MSTSSTIEETEPQTIADLGDTIERNEGRTNIANGIRKSGKTSRPAVLPPPPSEVESLKEDVRKLKETVDGLKDSYNRHVHASFDGAPTSPANPLA
jgi:hypothetical protein